jgi:hypothetical protein
MPDEPHSIRSQYEQLGADAFYQRSGKTYRNPHEPDLLLCLSKATEEWSMGLRNVLDLAAGSGEMTLALHEHAARQITGVDPYTFEAYESRTGKPCERLSFEQIADGALSNRRFSLIVCSFAMHLCEKSRLPALCLQLSLIAPQLLIFTPHKRPVIREEWGWTRLGEFVLQRIRARLYNSSHTHGRKPDDKRTAR